MKEYIVYQIDAFTKTRFKGNPAGVVVNADGLSEDQMQKIARELNNSETSFLFSAADGDNYDCEIRYFTPVTEVPTCGHATIAAMHAKTIEEELNSCVLNVKTKIGVLPFEIRRSGDQIKVWMTQGNIEITSPLPQHLQDKMLTHLGLSPEDVDIRCPVQIASTGHSKVMVGINSRDRLNSLSPDMHQLKQLSHEIDCNGYFVFTLNADAGNILSYGRMFAPAVGINEDPVTGNANGPLGAYLVHNQLVNTDTDTFAFKGAQGEAIERDGIVEVKVSIEDGTPTLVKIGGEAVTIFKTVIAL